MKEADEKAAEMWTDWMQTQLSARYPFISDYRIHIDGNRAHMINASGDELGSWRTDRDFLGGLICVIAPLINKEQSWIARVIKKLVEGVK